MGTLRSNRKNKSKTVTQKNLKRGEHIAKESNNGILIEKWKDRRDVLTLNTKFIPEMITLKKRSGETTKPKSIIEYNKHKAYIDLSDQMKSYNSSLHRGVKWYRKLAIELVVGSAMDLQCVHLTSANYPKQNVDYQISRRSNQKPYQM